MIVDDRALVPTVAMVQWPADADEVQRLRALGRLRLLLVAADAPPPETADIAEDWIRLPASHGDVVARAMTLAARASAFGVAPLLRGDGRITYGGKWAALSKAEEFAAGVLTEHFGEVVDGDTFARRGGRSLTSTGVRTLIMRVRRRIAPLGLEVRTIHGRGYLMEPA